MSSVGATIGSPELGDSMLNVLSIILLGFHDGLAGERHVDGHLVAVEVGVEGRAYERVKLDGAAVDENRLESLDAEPVKRRGAVEQNKACR